MNHYPLLQRVFARCYQAQSVHYYEPFAFLAKARLNRTLSCDTHSWAQVTYNGLLLVYPNSPYYIISKMVRVSVLVSVHSL